MTRFLPVLLFAAIVVAALPAADEPEPAKATNLDQLNSKADEDEPHLSSTGLALVYSLTSNGKTDLMVSQRRVKTTPWKPGEVWPQFMDKADNRSAFVTRDNVFPQIFFFASNKDLEKNAPGDNYDIYYYTRPNAGGDFTIRNGLLNVSSAADEMHPWVTVDNAQLYYSRKDPEGWHVYLALRPEGKGPFQKPNRVPLPDGFHHPTLMPNGLTMYLQGPLEKGRSGIFRSNKVGGKWTNPEPVVAVNHPEAPLGDRSPNLSRDGQFLFFASDRPGGKGGLDIWWIGTAQLAKKP